MKSSDQLGGRARCMRHEDVVLGDAVARNQDCLVAVGRYVLGITQGSIDTPSVTEPPLDTISQAKTVKDWFEAGPKR